MPDPLFQQRQESVGMGEDVEDSRRMELMSAIERHFLGVEPLNTFEETLFLPRELGGSYAREAHDLRFMISRTETVDSSSAILNLNAFSEVRQITILDVGIESTTGRIVDFRLVTEVKELRLAYREDGSLEEGSALEERVGRERLDAFLLMLCGAAGLSAGPSWQSSQGK